MIPDSFSSGSPALCVEPHVRVLSTYDAQHLRDTGALDDLTRFAAHLCDSPIALVTLLEDEYQHFIAQAGFDRDGTPRDISFCTHAVMGREVMIVPDTHEDFRFVDNPLVTGEPHVRFYAGAPLLAADGRALGTLCILDPSPRDGLTPLQYEGLVVLAAAAMARLDDRRAAREQGLVAPRAGGKRPALPHPGGHDAPDGLVDPARRLPRLLQRPLV